MKKSESLYMAFQSMLIQAYQSFGIKGSEARYYSSGGYSGNTIPTAKSSFKQNDRIFRKISAKKKANRRNK